MFLCIAWRAENLAVKCEDSKCWSSQPKGASPGKYFQARLATSNEMADISSLRQMAAEQVTPRDITTSRAILMMWRSRWRIKPWKWNRISFWANLANLYGTGSFQPPPTLGIMKIERRVKSRSYFWIRNKRIKNDTTKPERNFRSDRFVNYDQQREFLWKTHQRNHQLK